MPTIRSPNLASQQAIASINIVLDQHGSGRGEQARDTLRIARHVAHRANKLEVIMPRNGKAAGRKVAPPRIRGEKFVKGTEQTLPVARTRKSAVEKSPMPVEAMDHRMQVTGTDELRRGRRRPGK